MLVGHPCSESDRYYDIIIISITLEWDAINTSKVYQLEVNTWTWRSAGTTSCVKLQSRLYLFPFPLPHMSKWIITIFPCQTEAAEHYICDSSHYPASARAPRGAHQRLSSPAAAPLCGSTAPASPPDRDKITGHYRLHSAWKQSTYCICTPLINMLSGGLVCVCLWGGGCCGGTWIPSADPNGTHWLHLTLNVFLTHVRLTDKFVMWRCAVRVRGD